MAKANQIVHVVVYSHKHGDDVNVYATDAGARASLAEIARMYWADMYGDGNPADDVPETPEGLSDEEAARLYFANMDGESAEIVQRYIGD